MCDLSNKVFLWVAVHLNWNPLGCKEEFIHIIHGWFYTSENGKAPKDFIQFLFIGNFSNGS